MKLNIEDDDGFIAIVNGTGYQSFLSEDWQFDQLMAHFTDQMNAGNIVIWQTSNDGGGNWQVLFQNQPSEKHAFRQFDHFINATSGGLFLTNYADLTMAAQFGDSPIPAIHNADLKIELENGWYKLTVRQLFDPDKIMEHIEGETNENISFEVIIAPSFKPAEQQADSVFWFEL